ncbi:DUF4091 domain-containing protein [Bifidobacterium sp. 82T10]|uniref:DUF4091 domain-containing protein n=1 Tax=Bifidobacterium miconis TaxID=2834435 RepID=A0ABS6WEN8_9BIFI|nr:DUF4091 domain-containing protein [Bifidobacterium miconis]MBW3092490.1 DUF4091 domain-containing protein [Bifidobacterium miconis]
MPAFDIRIVGSLEKVFLRTFADDAVAVTPDDMPPIRELEGLGGETVSFQIAYRYIGADVRKDVPDGAANPSNPAMRVTVSGPLAGRARIRRVENVPVTFPAYQQVDDAYISTEPGLYPDLLRDVEPCVNAAAAAAGPAVEVIAMPGQWRSLWVDVELPSVDEPPTADAQAAVPAASPVRTLPLRIDVADARGNVVESQTLDVRVIARDLPEQGLVFTEWLYADCLADYYGVPVFSEEHWRILERFVRTAVRRGVTMILTPLFTPPLDTVPGGERTTTQLIGVTRLPGGNGGKGNEGDEPVWGFDFTLFDRWVATCRRCGVKQFEMSHLFTQWGAAHPPKIVANVDGEIRRVFGWEHSATDERDGYPAFLRAFLPKLDEHLHALGIAQDTYFHISDEPRAEHLDSYLAAKRLVAPLLEGYPIIDALSDIAYWRQGVCERPVPCEDTVDDFIDANVPDLWTYYCCAQNIDVPNRFMSMPSYRNRILGFLLFKYDMAGFLHWGYNFYNTANSTRAIDPYQETGAGDAFPAGDSFAVYPGRDGEPEESIRLMVMQEALDDLRACRLLESMIGHQAVVDLLEQGLERPLAFRDWPHGMRWLLEARRRVNEAIAASL